MAKLVVEIDGSQASRQSEELRAKLNNLSAAADKVRGSFGSITRTAGQEVRHAMARAGMSMQEFARLAETGSKGAERAMAKARQEMDAFRRSAEQLRASGGPVPRSWITTMDHLEREYEQATQRVARFRATQEAANRTLNDATRAAGGVNRGFSSTADILGLVNPKFEQFALKAGLAWAALEIGKGVSLRIVDAIGQVGTAFGANADKVSKAVAQMKSRIETLFLLGPQFLLLTEAIKKLRNIQDFSGVQSGSSSVDSGAQEAWEIGQHLLRLDEQRQEAQREFNALVAQGNNLMRAASREQLAAIDERAKRLRAFAAIEKVNISDVDQVSKAIAATTEARLQVMERMGGKHAEEAAILRNVYAVEELILESRRLGIKLTDEQIAKMRAAALTVPAAFEEAAKASTSQMEQITENFLRNVQGAMADTFEQILSGNLDSWEQLFKEVYRLFIRMLAEMAAALAVSGIGNFFAGKGAANGGNNWMSTLGSLLGAGGGAGGAGAAGGGAAGGAGAAGWGAAAGWAAGAAFVAYFGYKAGWWGKQGEKFFASATFGGDYGLTIGRTGGTDLKNVTGRVREVLEAISAFLKDVNIEVERFAKVTLAKSGSNYFAWVGDSRVGPSFGSGEEAMEWAKVAAIKYGELAKSVSEFVRVVVANSEAMTLDALKADIEFARMIEGFGKSDFENEIAGIGKQFDEWRTRLLLLMRGNFEQLVFGLNQLTTEELSRWTAQVNNVMGIQMSPKEQREFQEQQRQILKAQLELRVAELKSEQAALKARADALRARLTLNKAEIEGEREFVRARGILFEGEVEMMSGFLQISGEALEAQLKLIDAQAEAIGKLIAGLEDLIKKLGGKIKFGTGGGMGPTSGNNDPFNPRPYPSAMSDDEKRRQGLALAAGAGSSSAQIALDVMAAKDALDAFRLEAKRFGMDAVKVTREIQLANFASVGLQIAEMLGDEEAIAAFREIQYDIEKANMRLRIELLLQEGLILRTQYDYLMTLLGKLPADLPKVAKSGPTRGGGFQDTSREAENLARQFRDVAEALRDFRASLLTDENLSPLLPEQRLLEAKNQYDAALASARGKDIDAARSLPDLARQYIEIFRGFTGGGADYSRLVMDIYRQLGDIERLFGGMPKYAEGGLVTRPQVAMVGERGPEAVVPLKSGYKLTVSDEGTHRLLVGYFQRTEAAAQAQASEIAQLRREVAELTRTLRAREGNAVAAVKRAG